MDKKHKNLQSKSQTFIRYHIFPVIFIERGFRGSEIEGYNVETMLLDIWIFLILRPYIC